MRIHESTPTTTVLLVFTALSLSGCSALRQMGLGFESLFLRTEADYDALEADRSGGGVLIPLEGNDSPSRWTAFRGSARDGRCTGQALRLDWSDSAPEVRWRQPIGGGYSSFVIAHSRVFTQEQRRENEAITAYDFLTGKQIWIHEYHAMFSEAMAGEGPRATPTYHEGKLYALGATGEFRCLDAMTGKVHWRRNLLEDTGGENLDFGLSASPLVVGNKVVALTGTAVVACDLDTGTIVWKSLPEMQSYASPVLVTLAGKKQILTCTASRVVGLETSTGELLWEYPWEIFQGLTISQPIVLDDRRVVVSGSYGEGAAMFEIIKNDAGFEVQEKWQSSKLRNKYNSSVVHDGFIYGLDEGILVCLDPETGKRPWKAGRYGYGQVLINGDVLVVLGGKGTVTFVRARPDEHEELGSFEAFEGNTWSPPALVDGRLFLRNAAEMACFDLRVNPDDSNQVQVIPAPDEPGAPLTDSQ